MGVDGGIVAVVDTTNDEGWTAGTQLGQGHFHAVNRTAVARPYGHAGLLTTLFQRQRYGWREGTRHAAAVPLRGTDEYLAIVAHHAYKFLQTLGMVAVVVRDEYQGFWLFHC